MLFLLGVGLIGFMRYGWWGTQHQGLSQPVKLSRNDLPSRRTAWVIFCIVAGQMILLHGFIKKTQQTPKRDLDIARVRKAETEQLGEETHP